MRHLLALALLVGCSGAPSDAGPDAATSAPDLSPDLAPLADDVSATLEPPRKTGGLPALGAAVWRGDRLLAIGMAGVRKQGDPTPATITDRWHLGSETKAMTATLIGIHVDRGTIRLDDRLGAAFSGENVHAGYAAVTIEQLLQHRGGAPANMPQDIWARMWSDGSDPAARLRAVRSLLARAPAQAPGTFAYSNAGYMIAGAALERATGKRWEELMREQLFAPLGMASCGFGAPGSPDAVDEPWGHRASGGALEPVEPGPRADNPPSLGPAGTVHCALADWGKFLAVHLAAARGEPTIVSAPVGKRLQTPPTGGDYAAGWGVTTRGWAGGIALTHSGSNTMWFVTAWLAPAKNLAFAVVTNTAADPAPRTVDGAFAPLIKMYGAP